MVLFQIIFFGLLGFELLIALAFKFNWLGLKDKLLRWFRDNDVEDFIKGDFSNKWIGQILVMIILLALCLC